jgi:hypothetical protein
MNAPRVLFISPQYPAEMNDFTRGLAEVSAEVWGLADGPVSAVPAHVRRYLKGYVQAPLQRPEAVLDAVRATMRAEHIRFDRIECLWEPFVELAAFLREQLGIPGMSLDTAFAFRDKEAMKRRVEAAGLRVPHHAKCATQDEVRAAVRRIGYPVCIKPIAGAGSADTFRVDNDDELSAVLQKTAHVESVSVEEFVEGEEFTFDTVCIDGKPVFYNIAQYHPRPLIARSNEWISPVVVTLRDVGDPKYASGVELGFKVLDAMGMGTGFTHMEWYRKANGEVVFGEIGGRSAGGHLVDQMNWGNDIDLFREWARAVTWKSVDPALLHLRRPYNCAIIFKRALGEGVITRVEGVERFMQRFGQHVVAEQLLRPGQRRRNWLQTLVSDGFVAVRHPDIGETLRMAEAAATDIQLYAG